MHKILVVEDEPAIQSLIAMNLRRQGYECVAALDANSAVALITAELPVLVILDWMLPDRPGTDLLKMWRADARTAKLPIIMVTARSEEEDIVRALTLGADDYLTKPFSTNELAARTNALLRRARPDASKEPVLLGALSLDPQSVRVTFREKNVELSPLEFRLLHYFMKSPNIVHSRAKLLDAVWGDHVFIEERTVDVHIRRLRATLAVAGAEAAIETVRGGGYRAVSVV
jgi:two-component system, OmpR family, phosphate regulon response regulator PhoB